MPTDVLRDAALGRLNLPNDTRRRSCAKLTDAEDEFYELPRDARRLVDADVGDGRAHRRDRSARRSTATTSRSGTGAACPSASTDVRVSLSADGKKLTIDPPRTGWMRGDRYVAVLRGGAHGRRRARAASASSATRRSTSCARPRRSTRRSTSTRSPATPRRARGERAQARGRSARTSRRCSTSSRAAASPRADVAALWAFTVDDAHRARDGQGVAAHAAADRPDDRSARPGTSTLPAAPWDRPVEAEAKRRLAEFDGFGLSAEPAVRVHRAGRRDDDRRAQTVQLYQTRRGRAGAASRPTSTLMADRMHVVGRRRRAGRLAEATTLRGRASTTGVRDANGRRVVAMPVGHFLTARAAGARRRATSQIPAIDADDAEKLEALARAARAGARRARPRSASSPRGRSRR